MKIAVVGGGHGAYASAVEMSEKGHDVHLWRRSADAFGSLQQDPVIRVRDHAGERQVPIARATGDLGEAIENAELVLIPLPATSHASLAPQLAPLLEDGQVVFMAPGTFGSYLFAKAMAEAGNSAEVSFAETGTLPYLARKHAHDQVTISVYATRLPTGVYPASRSESAFAVLKQAYASVEPLQDALSGALMNAGPIIHPPLIIMNAGPLEHFDAWDIHNEGTQPAIRSVTNQLDDERMAIREAFGYGAPHFPLADHYNEGGDEWMYGNAAHEKLTDSGDWREKIDLENHRYMLEDVEQGLAFLGSCATFAKVDAPVTQGLLALGSAIVGRDFRQTGRTLNNLGLADHTPEALQHLLQHGANR